MALNAFAAAKAVPPAAASKRGKEKERAQIVGLEDYAALDAIINALTAMRDTAEGAVKTGMKDFFVRNGTTSGLQPDNFEGFEGDATASCELRKRSSRSALSDAEVAVLKEHGIPYKEEADRTETYIINPLYLADSAMLEKVGKAIAKVPGVPDDFIQFQAATKRRVTTEETLAAVFSTRDENKISVLMALCGTLAVKGKISDMETALDIVRPLLFAEEAKKKADAPKAKAPKGKK